jgi:hypothetical protein
MSPATTSKLNIVSLMGSRQVAIDEEQQVGGVHHLPVAELGSVAFCSGVCMWVVRSLPCSCVLMSSATTSKFSTVSWVRSRQVAIDQEEQVGAVCWL